MKHILVGGMTDQVGGIETFLMNYCERLTALGFRFDFLCRYPSCAYKERIDRMGGRVFFLPQRSHAPLAYYRALHAFFRDHAAQYSVYWENDCMMNNVEPLRYAARYRIPTRIFHSHNSDNMDASLKGRVRGWMHRRNRARIDRMATDFWACSGKAGEWAFPHAVRQGERYRVIANAVDVERFAYQPVVRAAYRKAMQIEDRFVILHVGRFQAQKNHPFLITAFAEVARALPQALLVLVGEGEGLAAAQKQAQALGIAEQVLFTGFRADVPALMQAADLFVLPSLFEGLSLVAVEAQAAGLPCILSYGSPKQTQITGQVTFLPITAHTDWAAAMARAAQANAPQRDTRQALRDAGFDLTQNEQVLDAFFTRAMGGSRA